MKYLIYLSIFSFIFVSNAFAKKSPYCLAIKNLGAHGIGYSFETFCLSNKDIIPVKNNLYEVEDVLDLIGYRKTLGSYFENGVYVFNQENASQDISLYIVATAYKKNLITRSEKLIGYEVDCFESSTMIFKGPDADYRLTRFMQNKEMYKAHEIAGKLKWHKGIITDPYSTRYLSIYKK